MVCAEKVRLRDEYSATARRLRAALKNLGTKTGDELVKGLTASKAARAECAKARCALDEHKGQHGMLNWFCRTAEPSGQPRGLDNRRLNRFRSCIVSALRATGTQQGECQRRKLRA